MNFITNLLLLGIFALILSLVLTKSLINLMRRLEIVDIPSSRRAHEKITPRGGGIGLVLIYSVLLPIFEYFVIGSLQSTILILSLFIPISLISFLDDISQVPIWLRLVIHILCSCLAITWLIHPNLILHYGIPIYLDFIIGAFALLSFINVYNFMDGIDGITASQSIHYSITILILSFMQYDIIPNVDIVIASAIIIGCWSLGFIYFNWQPAKIFIGDVGSISLGFLIGVCLLTIASASAKLFAACVIASLYYIADGSITILIRMMKGEKIWEPHLQHFFQKSIQKGRSHKKTVKRIIKCNMLLMLLSIYSLHQPVVSIIGAILVVMITVIRSVI
jgi:UDP-N-acetylmuramyl pentapeptide phosphotransferase/UDP-N-acetylglucosamine-1-phosphate transferase